MIRDGLLVSLDPLPQRRHVATPGILHVLLLVLETHPPLGFAFPGSSLRCRVLLLANRARLPSMRVPSLSLGHVVVIVVVVVQPSHLRGLSGRVRLAASRDLRRRLLLLLRERSFLLDRGVHRANVRVR